MTFYLSFNFFLVIESMGESQFSVLDGEFVIKHTLLDRELVINTCLLW